MKIGILQAGHSPDALLPQHGDYGALFQRLLAGRGLEFQTYSVVDGEFPSGPQDAEGWLITGSRHGSYDDLPWIPPLEALIRDIRAADLPLVGICFGHQVIAQALGGKVEKFAGGWAVGPQTYDWGGRPVTLNAWHQDQVTERPEGATVCGSNPFCENAALVYGDGIFTVQAHPEFDADFVRGLIAMRGKGRVPDHQLAEATRAIDTGTRTDNALLADQIAHFLKKRELA